MRLDAHQHFWEYDAVTYNWIDDSMSVLKCHYLPEQLEPLLTKQQLEGCIAVQADQSERETEFLLALAKSAPFIKAVVGWVDLCAENIESRLEHYAQNPHLKGIRHIVQAEPENFVLKPEFQRGIGFLSQFNLVYDLLIYPSQLDSGIQLVSQFPNQKFVLNHCAKPHIKTQEIKNWKSDIQRLAQAENIYCKVSGLVTEADIKNWKAEDFRPYLEVVFEAFGEDRVIYGSDWPVCLLAAPYKKVYGLMAEYTAAFSSEARRKFFGDNAAKIYNIQTE